MPETAEGLVSTIIPVHNRARMLCEAVQSVLDQTYRPIEIIISDDGSTDDTRQAIIELAGGYPDIIRYVFNEKSGAGLAREAGRLLARGEFIQYLDSDDRLLPRKFEIQVKALREHAECGAAYGYIRFFPENGQPAQEPFKWSGRELPTLFPWLLVDRWWNTDCPLFRRSVTDAAGPWTNLRYSQDWEYDARVGSLGTKLVHCREFVCEQRHHVDSRQTGHGKWLEPEDRVRFFSLLLAHALEAGVCADSPELKHFARWVFSHARMCGEMGDADAARQCFEIALRAAGRETFDLKAYKFFANLFGWRFAGRLTQFADRRLKRRPGVHTLKQSWMK